MFNSSSSSALSPFIVLEGDGARFLIFPPPGRPLPDGADVVAVDGPEAARAAAETAAAAAASAGGGGPNWGRCGCG